MRPVFLCHAVVLIVVTGMALLADPAESLSAQPECSVPERFYAFEPLLTKTPRALAGGRDVVIAALGGASTVGLAAGKLELAWPARLAAALSRNFPSARAKVANLGVARQTAKRARERLDRDIMPLKPTLVIWETGTMEAVRGLPVGEFRETLQAGIDELRGAGTELLLMDTQFSRDTDAIIDFEPYLAAMRELADMNDLPLFPRHGIMRHWAESGSLDLRTRDGDKGRELAAKLYDCIGRAMAEFVTRGVPAAKTTTGPGSVR